MVINTPSNPSGKVFTRVELEGLAKIAEEFDLFLFTDEIYEHFVYGGATHLSPASIPGMRNARPRSPARSRASVADERCSAQPYG